jgi:site-specific recombinase XerD
VEYEPMKDLAKTTNGDLKRAILEIQDNYTDDTRIFVDFLESQNLEISYEGLIAFVKHLEQVHHGKRLSAETINKRIKGAKNRIRYIFEHSPESLDMEKAYKLEKALREVKMKKTSKSISREKVLTFDEIKLLIDQTSTANPPIALMIEFLAHTGCRISEMLNVLVSDMKESKENWKIRIPGKGGKERTIMVDKDLIARITAHFTGKNYLFEHNHKQYRREYLTR